MKRVMWGVAIGCLVFAACTGEGGSSSSGTTGVVGSSGTTGINIPCVPVSWPTVSALFTEYCTTCHRSGGTAAQYVDLSDQNAATADARNIYAYVSAGLMPQDAGIDPNDRTTILSWAAYPSGVCPSSSTSGSGTSTGSAGTAGSTGSGTTGSTD